MYWKLINQWQFFFLQIGIRGKDLVVLGVEKKAVAKLQEDRTVRKIALLDEHVAMAFAGEFLAAIQFWFKTTMGWKIILPDQLLYEA